ncbi:MAG: hypothetical protein JNK74_16340 [Candidatus Hydrogenedentes bacterium]|nr:hypothetical protein [Candidatus Hydrogenedentota bacterium]
MCFGQLLWCHLLGELVIPKLPGGLSVLYRLLNLVVPEEVYLDFLQQYRDGGKFYRNLKKAVAEHVSKFNDPANNDDFIQDFLRENAKKVIPVALDTVESCREAMGIGRSLYRG